MHSTRFMLFGAIGVVISLGAVSGQTCGGVVCGKDSPCCSSGVCGGTAGQCMNYVCEPQNSFSQSSCWAPESCISRQIDFSSGNDLAYVGDYSGDSSTTPFVSVFFKENASVKNGSLDMELNRAGDKGTGNGTTVVSTSEVLYGRFTARIQAGNVSNGVVGSFILQNKATHDEIDFEWVGKNPNQVQTNFYSVDPEDYNNMIAVDVSGAASAFHDYTIDWSENTIKWEVDGKVVRVLNKADTLKADGKYHFPSTESYLSFSLWDGGNSVNEGTQQWAGPNTDFAGGKSYSMLVDSVNFECRGGNVSSSMVEPESSESQSMSISESGMSVSASSMDSSSGEEYSMSIMSSNNSDTVESLTFEVTPSDSLIDSISIETESGMQVLPSTDFSTNPPSVSLTPGWLESLYLPSNKPSYTYTTSDGDHGLATETSDDQAAMSTTDDSRSKLVVTVTNVHTVIHYEYVCIPHTA